MHKERGYIMEVSNSTPKIQKKLYLSYCNSPSDSTLIGHSHPECELISILEGSFELVYDNMVLLLRKGEVILIPPKISHLMRSNKTPGNHAFVIQTNILNMDYSKSPKIYKLTPITLSLLDIIIKEIKRTVLTDDDYWYDGFEGFSKTIFSIDDALKKLIEVYIHLTTQQKSSVPDFSSGEKPYIFNQAINYMNSHLKHRLTISDIANHCHVSPSTLKNVFRDYSGLGVIGHFYQLKINATKPLLEKDKPISYISDTFGFSSQSYYTQAFKRITGITPIQYKKSKKYTGNSNLIIHE